MMERAPTWNEGDQRTPMNNRQSGANPIPVTAFRQEDDRKREEARVATLQAQVDELRQALRELASRQVRVEEGLKQYEGGVAQSRLLLDQMRNEGQQSLQARALDENRTRQQIADLEARVDDISRPVRALQAHVAELLETTRRKTDDTGQNQKRFDELKSAIEHLSAIGDRNAIVAHQLRDTLDMVKGEIDQVRRDLLRAEDGVRIVDQEARRRTQEVVDAVETTRGKIDEMRSDIAHSFDLIEEVRGSVGHIDPSFEELRTNDATLRTDLTRFQTASVERHETILERYEDLRQEVDGHVADLRTAQDQRVDRLIERIEGIAEMYRDMGMRTGAFASQLDELRQTDEMLRRDLWHLNEQRVRVRLEQIQQELELLTGQRRETETGPPAEIRQINRTTIDY
jgi:chromosome segregation ATPase